jgi:hypothetical protein
MKKLNSNGVGKSTGGWRVVPVVALLTLGLIGLGANLASASPQVPLNGSVSGTVTPTSETTFELVGSGNASHLGKVGYEGHVQITDVDPNTGVITDVLTETFTAANGDTLTLLCNQVATPVSPGVYDGVDQWTVIGGTGRFENAEGSGTASTHVDLSSGTFTKELTGTISYGGM